MGRSSAALRCRDARPDDVVVERVEDVLITRAAHVAADHRSTPERRVRPFPGHERCRGHRGGPAGDDEAGPIGQGALGSARVHEEHDAGGDGADGREPGGRARPEQGCRGRRATGEHDGVDVLRRAVREVDRSVRDTGHLDARPESLPHRRSECVHQFPHPRSRPKEQGSRIGTTRGALRGLGTPDQASLGRLPRDELREGGRRRQPIDISRVESGEQRRDRSLGGLVTEPPAEQLAERLLRTMPTRPLDEIGEGTNAAA